MNLASLDPQLLLLCFMRVSGFVFAAPVFGSKLVPRMVRLWFSVLLAVAIMPAVSGTELPEFAGVSYFLLAAREVLLGVLIGFVSTFFIYGVEFAGHVLGLQMGFAASTLFDPFSKIEVSVIGRFQGLLAIVLFLTMEGHHVLLSGFAASYRAVPMAVTGFDPAGAGRLVAATAEIFTVAVRIAIPVLGALFLIEVGIALLAKTVPQMNIFVVGFPVKIAVGLAIMGFSIPYFTYVLMKALGRNYADLRAVLGAIGGG
jgi:flagellar biosynthetic protein FliR